MKGSDIVLSVLAVVVLLGIIGLIALAYDTLTTTAEERIHEEECLEIDRGYDEILDQCYGSRSGRCKDVPWKCAEINNR